MIQTILNAAIRSGALILTLPRPARHVDIRDQMARLKLPTPASADEGFLTSEGKFVGRHQAMKIAVVAGFKRPPASAYEPDEDPDALHSEDLW